MSCMMSRVHPIRSRILLLGDDRSTFHLRFSLTSSLKKFCSQIKTIKAHFILRIIYVNWYLQLIPNLIFYSEVDFLQNVVFDYFNWQRILFVEFIGFSLVWCYLKGCVKDKEYKNTQCHYRTLIIWRMKWSGNIAFNLLVLISGSMSCILARMRKKVKPTSINVSLSWFFWVPCKRRRFIWNFHLFSLNCSSLTILL